MIYVVATITTLPGQSPALISGARVCIDATRSEAGCISYDYVRDTENPDIVLVVERWSTREALAAHMQTPHLADWRKARQPLVKSTKVEIIHADQVEVI
ncbi:putative quinol monooxygenase [Aestuariivirga litoralis]|uniref:putative quinol monooxygenase n=1 Tax=Aestuariivirga litoralis TaxID=2650924 RepID=UPI0018C55AAD|nr:putative quinol monooxygenase [Aestuariivirga litoralis]MBG1232843.1 antibiotic biosynthesis monooxygenase [Aestuariivirga litoralis]